MVSSILPNNALVELDGKMTNNGILEELQTIRELRLPKENWLSLDMHEETKGVILL